MATRLEATCHCGASHHAVNLQPASLPLSIFMCHCDSCRHLTGTLGFPVFMHFSDSYTPSPHLLSSLTSFDFSSNLIVYFCPTCSCIMLVHVRSSNKHGQWTWALASGSVQRITRPGTPASSHLDECIDRIHHEHVIDTLDGGCTNWLAEVNNRATDRWPTNMADKSSSQLPLGWTSPSLRPLSAPRAAPPTIRGYCKCRSVAFSISTPDKTTYKARVSVGAEGRLTTGTEATMRISVPWDRLCLNALLLIPVSAATLDTTSILGRYQSQTSTMWFCKKCGATTFSTNGDSVHEVEVGVGLLDTEDVGARAEAWLDWEPGVQHSDEGKERYTGFVEALQHSVGLNA